MRTIFVYGTLRKGFYNYDRFGGDEAFKPHSVDGNVYIISEYKMYTNGMYPCIVKSFNKNDKVEGELYHIDDGLFVILRNMEIGAGYRMEEIQVNDGDGIVNAYVFTMTQKQVDNGMWKEIEDGIFK